MDIIRREVDILGNYRVLVSIDENQSREFKFKYDPSDEEVLAKAQKFVNSQLQEMPKMKNTVTQRQLRLWLLINKNITNDMIISLINQIPDNTEKQKALIELEYASLFDREHPLIEVFGTQLGMTNEELNVAFEEAKKI